MKSKLKVVLTIIILLVTITLSNLGQLFFSNEQFTKENNKINLKQ